MEGGIDETSLYDGRSYGDEASLTGVLLAILTIPIAMSVRLVQSLEIPVVAALMTSEPSRVDFRK